MKIKATESRPNNRILWQIAKAWRLHGRTETRLIMPNTKKFVINNTREIRVLKPALEGYRFYWGVGGPGELE